MATTLASQVQELYIGYLGRAADKAGLDFWVKAIENGTSTLESVALGFTLSAEYKAAYEGLTTTQLVAKVYQNVLGRVADADGLGFWVGEINKGVVKADTLVKSMINSLGAIDQLNMDNKVQAANTYTTTAGDKYDLAAAKAAIGASTSNNPGQTFTLTNNVDALNGTTGNDTFIAGTAQIQAADVINGGAGTDTAKLYLDAGNAGLNASNVEIFNVQASGGARAFNATNVTGAEQIWSAGSTSALTIDGLKNNVTLGLDKTQSNLNANFVTGTIGAAETLKLATDASGTAAGRVAVAVDDGGAASKFTTLDVNAVAGKSFITISTIATPANATTDFTTLKTSGAGTVDLVAGSTAFNNLTTVELNAAGGSTVNLGANAKAVKVTGGAGNDTVQFAATQFNTQDVIDLGAGTNTLVLGDANLAGAATTELTKAINAAKGVTTLATSAVADVTINAARYSAIDSFATTAAVAGAVGAVGADAAANSGNSGAVGSNGALALSMAGLSASGESLQLQNNVTGAAGGKGGAGDGAGNGGKGGDGAAAVTLTMAVDSGADSFTLSNAVNDVVVKGGAGGLGGAAGANGAAGAAGTAAVGLNASQLETLNINVSKNLTILDGAEAGAASTFTSVDTLLGANAKVNITGSGNVDLGLVGTNAGANFENFTITAGDLNGSLRVATGAGNDVITVGSKGSTVAAGNGTDTITLGAGVDTVQFLNASNSGNVDGTTITTIDKVIGFQAGLGGDVLDFVGVDAGFFNLTSANRDAIKNAGDLKAAADAAANFITTNTTWAAFEYSGKTYAIYETMGTNTAYDGSGLLVELVGVTATDLVATNLI